MFIKKYLKNECVKVNAVVENKENALRLIASMAKNSNVLKNISEDEIFKKMIAREKLSTTGFGRGIAIPHCAIDGIDDFIIGVITLPQGVDFASMDKKPVKLMVFIVLPSDRRTEHVRVLSRISNALKNDNNIEELLKSKTEEMLEQKFLDQTSLNDGPSEDKEFNLFTIVIQDEKFTEPILNILAEVSECSISVLEGENAGKYLYNQPLFTNLWSNNVNQGYHLVVNAVAKKGISNDIIRKINSVIDDNKNKSGLMMIVQNLFYVNGSLDV